MQIDVLLKFFTKTQVKSVKHIVYLRSENNIFFYYYVARSPNDVTELHK